MNNKNIKMNQIIIIISLSVLILITIFYLIKKSKGIATEEIYEKIRLNDKFSKKIEIYKNAVKKLINEGAEDSFLILSYKDFYVQFVEGEEKIQLYCEVVSDYYLPTNNKLTLSGKKYLKELNFQNPHDENDFYPNQDTANYFRYISIKSDDEIVDSYRLTESIFLRTFRINKDSIVSVNLYLGEIKLN